MNFFFPSYVIATRAQIRRYWYLRRNIGNSINLNAGIRYAILLTSAFHFSYVVGGNGQTSYTFSIPAKGCGTRTVKCKSHACGFGNPVENVLIIQQDEFVTVIMANLWLEEFR